MRYRGEKVAFGAPGIPPRWTRGNKDGVGTAYSADSRLWFTIWRGIITEVYFPRVDQPQLRDMQFLISDGRTFFHEERRHLNARIERLNEHALGYRIVSTPPNRSYELTKEVIVAPHLPCLLERTRVRRLDGHREPLDLYVLAAPHLGVGGWANNAYVVSIAGRELLAAERDGLWMVVGANVPFRKLSVGYVGRSDGWNDLAENYRMDYDFDRAPNGNVALTGQLPVDESPEFTLGLGFGRGFPQAASALLQALGHPFEVHKERFLEQWERPSRNLRAMHAHTGDRGNLYHTSYSVTLAHEDKTFPGAFIASMSIPWGNAHGDEDRGGYHLVWTRDLCRVSMGLLAAGDTETPLRVLIYLAGSQQPDGGYPQNFWITGEPYWSGVQLDEVSFPILLAYKLKEARALQEFDPYDMILGAAHYLIENGAVTQQERWEELSGYSPSTLAANIAALVAAANFARDRGDANTARFIEDHADFLESHIEGWTVTTEGSLIPEIPRHYIRIHPVAVNDTHPDEDANHGTVVLPNLPANEPHEFLAKEIVDAGFLELVRFGVRRPDDPIIMDSLRVVDAVLKVNTPKGPCWRRYNHDGYGQSDSGGPFTGAGRGRAWPLLTGERGVYELAAGRDARPYLRTLERFAGPTGLLPEQVWDGPDIPGQHLQLGGPTGSATPLVWAHAEYLTLLRSIDDGKAFDIIPEVSRRYGGHTARTPREVWKHNRQVGRIPRGYTLRIQASEPFRLHYSMNGWSQPEDMESIPTGIKIDYVDLAVTDDVSGPIQFTFFWPRRQAFEGVDYAVEVR